MCHPPSGDTCHLGIGPTVRPKCQICLTRVAFRCCHVSCTEPATSSYGPATCRRRTCHVSPGAATSPVWTCHMSTCRTDLTRVLYGLYGQVQSASQNFACLARRTECDIFLIRTPFDIKIIPPESGRRAGRHGVGFVGFRALSFLSIFHALIGSWIRFRITPPNNKTFWSPKGYRPLDKLGIGYPACSLSLKDDYIRGSKTQ
jgi:hypothetical protein